MKKILSFTVALMLFISLCITVYAERGDRVVDMADLLDSTEEAYLSAELDRISEAYSFDVVVVTVNSLDGKTPTEYADDYFDCNGYGYGEEYDGILLLIDMGSRQWAMSTCGRGLTYFGDSDLDYIEDHFLRDLSEGWYYDAFITFARDVETLVDYAVNYGYDYSDDGYRSEYDHPFEDDYYDIGPTVLQKLGISALIGAVVSLIIVLSMKSSMKKIRPNDSASMYVDRSSFDLTQSSDQYLYRNVSKTLCQTESSSGGGHHGGGSSHTSSSGRSHGGSSGRF